MEGEGSRGWHRHTEWAAVCARCRDMGRTPEAAAGWAGPRQTPATSPPAVLEASPTASQPAPSPVPCLLPAQAPPSTSSPSRWSWAATRRWWCAAMPTWRRRCGAPTRPSSSTWWEAKRGYCRLGRIGRGCLPARMLGHLGACLVQQVAASPCHNSRPPVPRRTCRGRRASAARACLCRRAFTMSLCAAPLSWPRTARWAAAHPARLVAGAQPRILLGVRWAAAPSMLL